MGRFDDKPEDLERVAEEGEKAGDSGGMFIASKRLVNDLDKIYVAFLELATYGDVSYKGESKTKGQCNVASFTDDKYEGVYLFEMAPKHMKRFMAKLGKPQYNRSMLFEIERHGIPYDTQVYYEMEHVRDLTQSELDHLETVELHKLFSRQANGDSTTPTSPPPATGHKSSTFMKQCGEEAVRLGWAPSKAMLETNMVIASEGFFKGTIKSKDMTNDQQQRFLEGLKAMTKGQQPGDIVDVTADSLNLDEDVDFF
jgi:hypothetical protein